MLLLEAKTKLCDKGVDKERGKGAAQDSRMKR